MLLSLGVFVAMVGFIAILYFLPTEEGEEYAEHGEKYRCEMMEGDHHGSRHIEGHDKKVIKEKIMIERDGEVFEHPKMHGCGKNLCHGMMKGCCMEMNNSGCCCCCGGMMMGMKDSVALKKRDSMGCCRKH